MRIGLVTILTDDLKRMTDFYSNVLEFEIIDNL